MLHLSALDDPATIHYLIGIAIALAMLLAPWDMLPW